MARVASVLGSGRAELAEFLSRRKEKQQSWRKNQEEEEGRPLCIHQGPYLHILFYHYYSKALLAKRKSRALYTFLYIETLDKIFAT